MGFKQRENPSIDVIYEGGRSEANTLNVPNDQEDKVSQR